MTTLVPTPPKARPPQEDTRKKLQKGVRRASLIVGAKGGGGGRRSVPAVRGHGDKTATMDFAEISSPKTASTEFPDRRKTATADFSGLTSGLNGDTISSKVVRRTVFGDARALMAWDAAQADKDAEQERTKTDTVQSVHRSVKCQRIKKLFVESLVDVAQDLRQKRLDSAFAKSSSPLAKAPVAEEGEEKEEQEEGEGESEVGALPAFHLENMDEELTSTLDSLFDCKADAAYESMNEIHESIKKCVALLKGMRDHTVERLILCKEAEEAFNQADGSANAVADVAARLNADIERMQKALQAQAEVPTEALEMDENGEPQCKSKFEHLPEHCLHALDVLTKMKDDALGMGAAEGDPIEDDAAFNKMLADLHENTYGNAAFNNECYRKDRRLFTKSQRARRIDRSSSQESTSSKLGAEEADIAKPETPSQGSTADPGSSNDVAEVVDIVMDADGTELRSLEASDVETAAADEDEEEEECHDDGKARRPICIEVPHLAFPDKCQGGEEHDSDDEELQELGYDAGVPSGRLSAPPALISPKHGGRVSAEGFAATLHHRSATPGSRVPIAQVRATTPNPRPTPREVMAQSMKLPDIEKKKRNSADVRRMDGLSNEEVELLQRLLAEDDNDDFCDGRRRSGRASPRASSPRGSAVNAVAAARAGGAPSLSPPRTQEENNMRGFRSPPQKERMKDLRWHPQKNGHQLHLAQLSPVAPAASGAPIVSLVTPNGALLDDGFESAWCGPRQIVLNSPPKGSRGPSPRHSPPMSPCPSPRPMSPPRSTAVAAAAALVPSAPPSRAASAMGPRRRAVRAQ